MKDNGKIVHRHAAYKLAVLETLAPMVVVDMTREAVRLREQAAAAESAAERDELRYQAEGVYHDAQRAIEDIYGNTNLADEVDEMVYSAISAVAMPSTEFDDFDF